MKTITIYSTPTCGYCKQLKQFLTEKAIAFTDHDVTKDSAALEEMQKLTNGATSVPVIVFNKGQSDQKIQIGLDLSKVQSSLGI